MTPILLHLLLVTLTFNGVVFAVPAPAEGSGHEISRDARAFKTPPPVAQRIAALASGGEEARDALDDAAGGAKPDGQLNGKLSQKQNMAETSGDIGSSQNIDNKVCGNYTALGLLAHNVHRANHSAPALVWNGTLAAHAKACGLQMHVLACGSRQCEGRDCKDTARTLRWAATLIYRRR